MRQSLGRWIICDTWAWRVVVVWCSQEGWFHRIPWSDLGYFHRGMSGHWWLQHIVACLHRHPSLQNSCLGLRKVAMYSQPNYQWSRYERRNDSIDVSEAKKCQLVIRIGFTGKQGYLYKWVQNNNCNKDVLVCLCSLLLNAVNNSWTPWDFDWVLCHEVLIMDGKRAKHKEYLIQITECCLGNICCSCKGLKMWLHAVLNIYYLVKAQVMHCILI